MTTTSPAFRFVRDAVADRRAVVARSVEQAHGLERRRTALHADDVGAEHQRRRAVDDVIDLAHLIVLGDRLRRGRRPACRDGRRRCRCAPCRCRCRAPADRSASPRSPCRCKHRTSDFAMYVPGHILQVGCGSPCAATARASRCTPTRAITTLSWLTCLIAPPGIQASGRPEGRPLRGVVFYTRRRVYTWRRLLRDIVGT